MPDSHGPIEERHREQMRALGQALDATFNDPELEGGKQVGFCLLTFKFGEPSNKSRMNYICNANREDMNRALEEFINRSKRARNKPKTNERRGVDNLSSPLGLKRRITDIRLDIEFP